jgi:RNA polymerase sigma-70 factor (ECF subfamily)
MGSEAEIPGVEIMNGDRTRPSLLKRVRDLRDRKSWDEFIELYSPLILRCLLRSGASRKEALDLVQGVLCNVVKNIGHFQYDPAKGSFRGWLMTIARNLAYRDLDRARCRPVTPGGTSHNLAIQETPYDDDTLEELIEKEWQRRCLELALKKIRPEFKPRALQVFHLTRLGLSRKEIAEQLDMQVGAVFTSLSRVLRRLREAIKEIDDE